MCWRQVEGELREMDRRRMRVSSREGCSRSELAEVGRVVHDLAKDRDARLVKVVWRAKWLMSVPGLLLLLEVLLGEAAQLRRTSGTHICSG